VTFDQPNEFDKGDCVQLIGGLLSWEQSLNHCHLMARCGNLDGLLKLMRNLRSEVQLPFPVAVPIEMFEFDAMGCSALYWACVSGNLELVKLLLNVGLSPYYVTGRNANLLHVACEMGHSHIVAFAVRQLQVNSV
jgi:ankyrin repeat protein